MKPDIFLNRIVFRLTAPLIYGSALYILILLIFDSLSQLNENFFSQEILVTIVLSYLQFETIRGTNLLLEKFWKQQWSQSGRIILQFTLGVGISVTVISMGIWVYFNYVVGFSTFNTELITFNAMYVLTSVLYNLIYLSMFFLDKKNEGKITSETLLRKNLEADLESFKNEINPGLLFDSFESLIGLLHRSKKQADEFIGDLSSFYRYCLHNRNNDLVSLREELQLLGAVINILNIKHSGQIKIALKTNPQQTENLLVPCTLLSIIEVASRTSIINQHQALPIEIEMSQDFIQVKYPLNKRLGPGHDYSSRLEKIKNSYAYFSDVPFQIQEKSGTQLVNIPLLKIEESEA